MLHKYQEINRNVIHIYLAQVICNQQRKCESVQLSTSSGTKVDLAMLKSGIRDKFR